MKTKIYSFIIFAAALSWLGRYASPNLRAFDGIIQPKRYREGCILFVDPECELKVREGKQVEDQKVTTIEE